MHKKKKKLLAFGKHGKNFSVLGEDSRTMQSPALP